MRLASDELTLQTPRGVCSQATNLEFAALWAQAHGPKAAMRRLYGRRVKSLACGDGVVVDRPISLAPPRERTHAKRRSSGRSGKSK